jgi:adenosine kinase
MAEKYKYILVTGSLAYDYIMDFPGRFADHILLEKIHQLSVSFTLSKIEKNFGGTGGNIAYSLALLKKRPILYASAGNDFLLYKNWLRLHQINLSLLRESKKISTASAYIITDQVDNQIAGFYPGAMNEKLDIRRVNIKQPTLAIISANNKNEMLRLASKFKKMRVDYIFDPGQQLINFSSSELKTLVTSAKLVIANDYEMELLTRGLGIKISYLRKKLTVIVTYGSKGSRIYTPEHIYQIKAIKVKKPIDPTGAGDAYRAGLLAGLADNFSLEQCGALGATVASFAIGQYGTQAHNFTIREFNLRLKKYFGFTYDRN